MKVVSESIFGRKTLVVLGLSATFLFMCGCGGPSVSSAEQLNKFNRVGAIRHLQDQDAEIKSKYDSVYRVVEGDVLELTMPVTMQETSWEPARRAVNDNPYYCRVSNDGTITLPVVGIINVGGKTTSEVEAAVVQAHYPKYVVRPPAVVCSVEEHRDERTFAVMGLVKRANTFEYPPNARYTLMDALAMAGGPNIMANPQYATIFRQDGQGEVVSATFKINQKHLAQASKVLIEPGDIISVDRSLTTGINTALDQLFHFGVNVGASVSP